MLVAYLTFDYARIYIIRFDVKSVRQALWRGIRFTFNNFFRTFGITLIYFTTGVLSLLLYNIAADSIPETNLPLLLAMIALQQLYILFRTTLRLSLYGSQSYFYEYLVPVEPDPRSESVPG